MILYSYINSKIHPLCVAIVRIQSRRAQERNHFTQVKMRTFWLILFIGKNGRSKESSDYLLELTGSVVLNRVANDEFPNTIKEVWLRYKMVLYVHLTLYFNRCLNRGILFITKKMENIFAELINKIPNNT